MEPYPDLFEGVGTIDSAKVKLDVDPSISPVVQPPMIRRLYLCI